jgi:hypothetical protein
MFRGRVDNAEETADAILAAAPEGLVIASVEELGAGLAFLFPRLRGDERFSLAREVAARLAAARREPDRG